MKTKSLAIAALAATTAIAPATSTLADNNAAAFIFGAIAGAALERETNDYKATPKTSVSSANPVRAANRETQTALNYFGFNAGVADGIMGSKSRSATSQYQAHMGYPITGELTEPQRDFLISSYYRAQAGGTQTAAIAAGPGGAKQLLTMYSAEVTPPAAATGGDIFAVQTAPETGPSQPSAIFASTPAVEQPAATFGATPQEASAPAMPTFGAPEATTETAGGLPSFFGTPAPKSLASHCSTTAMVTNTNGGFQTEVINASDVIGEQICVARSYAMAQGEQIEKSLTGVTQAQIEAQCNGMAPLVADLVTSLGSKPRDQVIGDAATFVASSGMTVPQIVGTSKICLSVGYRTDNMDVALGSALILAASENKAYGELMGHHRALGFGVAEDAASAVSWYQMSLDALDAGSAPVFNPGQPERKELVRSASLKLQGNPASAMETPVTETGAAQLPTFSLQ
ncbi:MAG: peptidoglycan-binding domain-containing protein [Pseudomonadota bacterium]